MHSKIQLTSSTFFDDETTRSKLAKFILKSRILSMSNKCSEFEKKFSEKFKLKDSVLVNSGSSANLALIQSLINLGLLNKSDKVAFSALTWSTNVMPIIQLGLTPVPVDVSLNTLNISPSIFEEFLTKHKKIKALFITNVLGLCDDLLSIKKICEKNNILLIEDNCESLGSELDKKTLGTFGIASTHSFFVGHHLSTIEGGMISSSSDKLIAMLKIVRAHGWSRNLKGREKKILKIKKDNDFYEKYKFHFLGYNLRPTEITGFIGLNQLTYLDKIISTRMNNYNYLRDKLNHEYFYDIHNKKMNKISNFAYPLVFKKKVNIPKISSRLNELKIENRPIIAGNITKHFFYKNYFKKFKLKNSDYIHKYGLYIPNHEGLSKNDLRYIVNCIENFYE